jgi:outer membrane protein OmpA-like peptidoglycan-associated protein
MSKRWLGLLFFMVWIGGSGVAHAAVIANPDPVAIGTVQVGQSQTATTTLSANPQVDIETFDLSAASCSEFQVTPPSPLPLTVGTGGGSGGAKTVTVQFTPTLAGAKTCTIVAKDSGGTTLGTFTATGTAIAPTISVTPASADFGNVRVDTAAVTTATQVFMLSNTGDTGSTLSISDIAFSDPSYSLQPAPSFPIAIAAGANQTVTVAFDPATAGTHDATMTIASNDPATPTKTIDLTGTGTTATIAVTDVSFGTVTNGTTSTQNIAVTNSSASSPGVLTVTSATIDDTSGFFSFDTTLGCTGGTSCMFTQPFTVTTGTLDVPVRCHPPAAATGTQSATVTFVSDADPGGDTTAQLTCTAGRPDIMVSTNTLAFGNVLVGSTSAAQTVTATNNGNATLTISSATLAAGAADYTIVTGQTGSQMIAPGASATWDLACKPSVQGGRPGAFQIASNALTGATTDVALTCTGEQGNGTSRKVAFGPPTINLGYAAVGFPITAADILAVTNLDPSVPFKIHAIELDDDSVFRITDPPADVELPATMASSFSVTFEPTTEGHFETTARLFLDQDGQEQATVTITGDAVFIDAHGSGGCHAGGAGAGSGAALAFGMLVASGALRRRRRRAGQAIATTALVATIAIAPAVHAEGIGITVFEPTPATRGTGFQLQSPEVGSNGSWGASAVMSFASNPLVLDARNPDGTLLNSHTVIENSSGLQLGGAYALLGRFEVGAHIPLYMQSGQADGDPRMGFTHPPASGTARGNLRLHAKARLGRARGGLGSFVAGASAIVVVPTASQGQFTGSDQPELRLLALGSFTPAALASRLALSVNAGAVLRGKSEYANIVQQSGVAWSVGASYRVLDALWATTEVFGEATASGRRQQAGAGMMPPATVLSPVEWLAGLSYRLGSQVTVGLAGGRGVTDGLGTPAARAVFSLAFVPGAPAPGPTEPDQPDKDADGDGISDRADGCPSEPEDKDGFDDADGCADPDNDGDGVPDARDRCALEPEDKDGFQDDNGCPETDNDGDGIPDAKDKCQNEPEDKDGFQDLDGCADPDNDQDGLADAGDKCPTQPETINGNQDDDGCPDKGDTTIILSPARIETLDPIQFTGLKLTKASLPLLEQVAATMRAHPEIVRMRVTVHVQPTEDPDADQARSDRRARAVREWLVQWGIAPARVEARGFGSTKPLVAADQRGAAKINDRIELIILERK